MKALAVVIGLLIVGMAVLVGISLNEHIQGPA